LALVLALFGLPAPRPSLSSSGVGGNESTYRGIPTAFPPSLIPARSSGNSSAGPAGVDPYRSYKKEPAPVGIADFGIGPSGPYSYSTNSSLGVVSIDSLSTKNATGYPWLSIQQNVVLEFTSGGQKYYYWVQNVIFLISTNNTVYFVDNVWNFTSLAAPLSQAAISGDGNVSKYGGRSYYAYIAPYPTESSDVSLVYPTSIDLEVNSSLDSKGDPQVVFAYDDGFGWVNYDMVTFNVSGVVSSLPGFIVDGSEYNGGDLFSDAELVLAGPGGGSTVADVQSGVNLRLEYWNGNNYDEVPNAYNFGADTGETISNTVSKASFSSSDGEAGADVVAGNGTLGGLYTRDDLGVLNILSPLQSGELYVESTTNSSASPWVVGFEDGNLTLSLYPGTYLLELYTGGTVYASNSSSIAAGSEVKLLEYPTSLVPLTLDFVAAGGTPTPTLEYVNSGEAIVVPLTAYPRVYFVDKGTSWTVSRLLSGSSSSQRWTTGQPTTGVATSPTTVSFLFYHQYSVSASYSVTGGGTPAPPTLTFESLGNFSSVQLTGSPQSLWADAGSNYSVAGELGGSNSTVRWYTSSRSGTIQGPSNLTFAFGLQFLLQEVGANLSSTWYDSGVQATVVLPGIYGRSNGTGYRVTSYSVDGGQVVSVGPTLSNVSVSVAMDQPHELQVNSVEQYQLMLGQSALPAIVSITVPTIAGDSYWYDAGSQVSLVLNGVWDRSNGTGVRLVSYEVDGLRTTVDSSGLVVVLNFTSISSPQSVTIATVVQYELNVSGGSVVSSTPPSIPGDSYWYDNATSVELNLNYSWNYMAGSRLNAIGYSLNTSSGESNLRRSGNGTFDVRLTMSEPIVLTVDSVRQYRLTVNGGSDPVVTPSVTGDDYYDQGSGATITQQDLWGLENGNSRQVLVSYEIDGTTVSESMGPNVTSTSVGVTFDSPQAVTFNGVVQYLVAFEFADASGTHVISPSSLVIDDPSLTPVAGPNFSMWFDSGTSLRVASVFWEGVNVGPSNSSSIEIVGPLNETIRAMVYNASLTVTDYLGVPVQGALVSARLSNGTSLTLTTSGGGSADLGLIPLGTFNGTVSSNGLSTGYSANATGGQAVTVRVIGSYPTYGLISAFIIIAVAIPLALRRRSKKRQAS